LFDYAEIIGKDCLEHGSRKGQTRGKILIMGWTNEVLTAEGSVSQTVVRGPQAVLGFCPCGPFRLNIIPKKDRKNQINVNCVSHTVVENPKQFALKADKSRAVRRTF
jgi:hypothetical protein